MALIQKVDEGQIIPKGLSYGQSEKGTRLYYATDKWRVKIKFAKTFPWFKGVSIKTATEAKA